MEEKEVIQYLKDNIRTGISFHFMPKEVQDWVIKNYKECAYLNDDGVWDKAVHHVSGFSDIWASDVYALIAGYEPKEHEKGWVEFEIDRDGYFQRPGFSEAYKWPAWCDFLRLYSDFVTFGGWYYEGKGWSMFPLVDLDLDDGKTITVERYASGEKAEPLVPSKIRFWRARI